MVGAPASPAAPSRHRHHDTNIGSVLVYSWQPVRALTGTDGARHAGMAQRLLQVVRSSCRLQLQVYYISGQAEAVPAGSLTRRRGQIFVEGCRVTHFHGHTEAQYAHFMAHVASERAAPPLFCLLFYTGAWFPVEQRAIRNITGWHRPESYLDEDAYDAGTGTKAGRLLHRLRADHAGLGVVVFTDDIQSEKLARVLPATATQRAPQGDAARVRHAVRWMRGQELAMYGQADAVATVSRHDAAWVERNTNAAAAAAAVTAVDEPGGGGAGASAASAAAVAAAMAAAPLVVSLPFVAHPPPPARVAPWGARTGLLYVGVAHTAAAQSMRWFLQRVHPRLLQRLIADPRVGGNISLALSLSQLTIVG